MKTCRACKETKPISEFYKNHSSKDGHRNDCKKCYMQYVKQYRQTEKGKDVNRRTFRKYSKTEKGKAYQKFYSQSEKGKASVRMAIKRYRIRHPDRERARQAVREAIKSGRLPRSDTLQCSCGEPAKHHHHHKGYEPTYWLDVVPVCRSCHNKTRLVS